MELTILNARMFSRILCGFYLDNLVLQGVHDRCRKKVPCDAICYDTRLQNGGRPPAARMVARGGVEASPLAAQSFFIRFS